MTEQHPESRHASDPWLPAVLAMGLLVMVVGSGAAVLGRAVDIDEARYANFSWTYLQEGKWEYGLHTPETRSAARGTKRLIWADLNRLYVGALAGIFHLTGPSPEASEAFSLACAAALLAGAYFLGRLVGGPWTGAALVAGLAFWPRLMAAATVGRPEAMLGAVTVWGFVALARGTLAGAALAGLLAGVAPGIHLNALAGIVAQSAWALTERRGMRLWAVWGVGLLVGLGLIWPWTLAYWRDVLAGGSVQPMAGAELAGAADLLGRLRHWVDTRDIPVTSLLLGRPSLAEPMAVLGLLWALLIPEARRRYRPALAAVLAVVVFFVVMVRRPFALYAVPFGVLWLLPAAGAVGTVLASGWRVWRERSGRISFGEFVAVQAGLGLGLVVGGLDRWVVSGMVAAFLALIYIGRLASRRDVLAMGLAAVLLGIIAREALALVGKASEVSRYHRLSEAFPLIRTAAGDATRLCGREIYWFAFPDRVYRDWDEGLLQGGTPQGFFAFLERERIQVLIQDQPVQQQMKQWGLKRVPKSVRLGEALGSSRGDLHLEFYKIMVPIGRHAAWGDPTGRGGGSSPEPVAGSAPRRVIRQPLTRAE